MDTRHLCKILKEDHDGHDYFNSLVEANQIVKAVRIFCVRIIDDLIENKAKLEELNYKNKELIQENSELDSKLKDAHKILYSQQQKLNTAIKERNRLMSLLHTAKKTLTEDIDMPMETKSKLSFLTLPTIDNPADQLDTILELNSTDGLMSELSYTLEEEESMKESFRRSKRNKRPPARFPSEESLDVSGPKRTRGGKSTYFNDRDEHIIATTTVRVPQNGPVSAVSKIESRPGTSRTTSRANANEHFIDPKYLPSAPPMILDSESETGGSEGTSNTPKRPFTCQTNVRLHSWQQKSHIMGETCSVCGKKMKFSTVAVKCTNCKAISHTGCKDRAQLPCVPTHTPNTKTTKPGGISDYVPSTSPMVPALVVYCIREIEARGMNEVGLYRVPGSDREVKTLKEKLLKAKGIVDLSKVSEVHTITGCLKDFLRSLKEPLIPKKCWNSLSKTSDIRDSEQKKNKFYQIVKDLPQPNRDTLAYIILHLQRVASSANCKMPVSNLSKMFGPSIVGYLSNDNENVLMETNISNKIMADLMLLPSECYEEILNPGCDENKNPSDLQKTPSQSSLLGFFTNSSSSIRTVKKFRFFETP